MDDRFLPARRGPLAAAALLLAALLSVALPADAQPGSAPRLSVEVEGGPVWTTRNDARKPTDTGTPFSFLDLTGKGPSPFVRLTGTLRVADRHAIRVLAAPLGITGTGSFGEPVLFVDRTFAPNRPTDAVYEFNTYRIGYSYLLHRSPRWQVRIGATGLVRDAKIELRQDGQRATDTDLGVVPLAAFGLRRVLNDRVALVFDVEGLGASQGRAIDAALKVDVELGRGWTFGAGYRTIEGGADVESVFSFAWIHFGVASIAYRF